METANSSIDNHACMWSTMIIERDQGGEPFDEPKGTIPMVAFDHAAIMNAAKNFANKLLAVDGAAKTFCDICVANGVEVENLKQNAQTTKPEDMHPARIAVDLGIVLSFTKVAQRLVNMAKEDAKGLLDAEKSERRHWKQQLASIRNKQFIIALDKRLNPDKYAKTKERTDDNIWIPARIAELFKRIQTTETFSGDLVGLADWMALCPISPSSE